MPCGAFHQVVLARQHDDLLGIVEATSSNLNQFEQPQMREGRVTRLLGFDFVETNRLPGLGATRSCPCWMPSKVKLGVWRDVRPRMWNDSSAGMLPYIEVDAIMDSTRVEDDGVQVIEASEV